MPDIQRNSRFSISSSAHPQQFTDLYGNVARRVQIEAGLLNLRHRAELHDSGKHEPSLPDDAPEVAVHDLPLDCMPFLVSSRYCESDQLGKFAWQNFGSVPPGGRRVNAIIQFVHDHLVFDYARARPSRTALDALHERTGVCRDFTHLVLALCRAMNIPARYVTGYLGDIGVPKDPNPMDFSAWCEVFVGGEWFTLDARHKRPRIGRIIIARGRDAADVPMIFTYGTHELQSFTVIAEEVKETIEAGSLQDQETPAPDQYQPTAQELHNRSLRTF